MIFSCNGLRGRQLLNVIIHVSVSMDLKCNNGEELSVNGQIRHFKVVEIIFFAIYY